MSLADFFSKLIFISFSQSCSHEKISPDVEQAYCPDCGKLIQNEWYITRCSCCGVKMKAMVKNGKIVPQHHFCTNCGSSEFSIEKLKKISFIDVSFAALIKREVEERITCSTTTCWEEKTVEQPKLLVQFL